MILTKTVDNQMSDFSQGVNTAHSSFKIGRQLDATAHLLAREASTGVIREPFQLLAARCSWPILVKNKMNGFLPLLALTGKRCSLELFCLER